MIAFTLIIARTVSIPAFIKGITVGASVALVATIVAAGGIPDDLAQVGALGSKNQVGEIAEIGLYCAILSWSLLKNPPGKTAFSVLPFMLCTICLYFSRSATSDVSLAAMLGISATIYIIARMPQKIRAPVFILAIICISALAIAATAFDWKDAGLKAVGKDSTLTGRTLLWSEGIRTAMQSPIFGVGQWAFWVPGTPEAEKLWFQFDITGRSGFHFHNLFINLLVEVGLCGCILWSLAYLTTCVRATGYLLKHGTSLESMFYVGMLYMYLVRALTEVDTATPYGFAPLIFFYVVMRVAERKSGNQAAPEARLPSTRRLPSGFLQINTGRR
jgi:exopolysaccharide production protein ExoQ